jgi:hypothetical protein
LPEDYDILNFLSNYDPYKNNVTKIILDDGISGLIEYAKDNSIELDSKGYYSVCDMCRTIASQIK